MTDDMTQLPYVFDLLHDIKYMYEVENIVKGVPSASDASPADLVKLFTELDMEIPACLAGITPAIQGRVNEIATLKARIAELETELEQYRILTNE